MMRVLNCVGRIKIMYVSSLVCVRVKGSECEQFMIDSMVSRVASCLLGFSIYIGMQ